MKIRTPYFNIITLPKPKWHILAILFYCFSISTSYSQSFVHIDNGDYQFLSDEPEWDLHFWLFDDGYHSPKENFSFVSKEIEKLNSLLDNLSQDKTNWNPESLHSNSWNEIRELSKKIIIKIEEYETKHNH